MRAPRLSVVALAFATGLGLAGLVVLIRPPASAEEASFTEMRRAMVQHVREQARAAEPVTGVAEIDERVLEAMREVPRHAFLPEPLKRFAYLGTPLPLGHGQNIASPYLVALMTHLAEIGPTATVFETGTGAGYHAAVLARLAEKVVTVEVVPELALQARENLDGLDLGNVVSRSGDGYYGWPEEGPYDAILLKEAVNHLPQPLVEQLKPGGRLVLPLGPLTGSQHLTVVRKGADGSLDRTRVLEVRFSPLQGGQRI